MKTNVSAAGLFVLSSIMLALFLTPRTAIAQSSSATRPTDDQSPIVARIDGEPLIAEELDRDVAGQIARLEEQIYRLRQQRLDVLIGQRLLAREAARRDLSKEALVQAEVNARARDVTDDEIARYYDENKAHLPALSSDLHQRIRRILQGLHRDERLTEFLSELRASAKVELLLAEPRSMRWDFSDEGVFVRGPANATVTIVEFSDFHCPFCVQVQATLGLVLAKYQDRVRLVYRDFPIDALHPAARQAHRAARCAGAQQRFWEYHDALLAGVPTSTREQLIASARQLELDVDEFERCLASDRFKELIDRDITEGARAGVTGTPAFFINGRRLEGARTLQAFSRLIDEELAKSAKKTTKGGER